MILDISDKEYFKSVGLNASALKEFAKSPAHYDAYVNRTIRKASDTFRIGSQAHKCILEDCLTLNIMPECDRRTKAGKATFKEFQESLQSSDDYVTKAEFDNILKMRENVLAHPYGKDIVNKDTAEKAAFVTCPTTGLELKCKYDCLPNKGNMIYDLKTCQDASPDSFKWDIKKFKYDIQDAHYSYIAELLGLDMPHFVFICVEKSEPFGVSAIALDPDTRHKAKQRYFGLLQKFAECQKEDNFLECYSKEVSEVSIFI